MKKILIIFILVFGVVTLVGAQENSTGEFGDETANCYKYKFSINFGNAFSFDDRASVYSYYSSVTPDVPYVYGVDMNNNPSTNMIGVEFRWMFKPNWSLNLTGLGILKGNPQQDFIEGIYDYDVGGYIIPNINAVAFRTNFDWNAEIGISRYFELPNKKLLPYIGFSFIYAHGSGQYENPLVITGENPEPSPYDFMGKSQGEYLAWGFTIPMGFEYYLSEGLFIGASINVANYFYSLEQIAAIEGMDLARADQSTFSFFTRPLLKLGIAF